MASGASGSHPQWHWPEDLRPPNGHINSDGQSQAPGAFQEDIKFVPQDGGREKPASNPTPKPEKHWPPRTCRICLETVQPTYHPPSDDLLNVLQSSPSVTYESSDPEAGRLIRPCKCKGSSRYVHEGCLQAWRHADPGYGKRNYWQCPTCGFRYRLERMRWGRWISSTLAQVVLTTIIFITALFFLGFIADPIINLYVDPYSALSTNPLSARIEPIFGDDEEKASWAEHFIKGFVSLGLFGFVKVLFALSPWHWWNIRNSGLMTGSGRAGGNGRDRLSNISWMVVLIGVGTALWVCVLQLLVRYGLTKCRPCTKAFALGVAAYWRKLEKELWMFR